MWENIEILNLQQQKEEIIWYQNLVPNYHTANFFTENLLAIEMRKTQILMNKPVYLGLSVFGLSKTVMY